MKVILDKKTNKNTDKQKKPFFFLFLTMSAFSALEMNDAPGLIQRSDVPSCKAVKRLAKK